MRVHFDFAADRDMIVRVAWMGWHKVWIMIAGPYRSGAAGAVEQAANLRILNEAAAALHRAGHVPVIGVNMALPVIEAAGGSDAAYEAIMMPLSIALADRCDACFRVGGPSRGADDEVRRFKLAGRPVYRDLTEIPPAEVHS
jgi:hypothetical protein